MARQRLVAGEATFVTKVRFGRPDHEALRDAAERAGVSISEFVRRCVDARLDDTERTPLDAA